MNMIYELLILFQVIEIDFNLSYNTICRKIFFKNRKKHKHSPVLVSSRYFGYANDFAIYELSFIKMSRIHVG